jgi:hypothetical protein
MPAASCSRESGCGRQGLTLSSPVDSPLMRASIAGWAGPRPHHLSLYDARSLLEEPWRGRGIEAEADGHSECDEPEKPGPLHTRRAPAFPVVLRIELATGSASSDEHFAHRRSPLRIAASRRGYMGWRPSGFCPSTRRSSSSPVSLWPCLREAWQQSAHQPASPRGTGSS